MAQIKVTDAVTEPPESFAPPETPVQWIRFEHYPNPWHAHIVAGLLENEGVPAVIETNSVLPGAMDDTTVWVPQPLTHRARWILALLPPTDAELTFLATGELLS